MTHATAKNAPPWIQPGAGCPYLGSGCVTAFEGPDVVVALDDGREVDAEMALAFPYRPVIGDALLVIGREEEGKVAQYFVIGVLHGRGRAVLEMQGDVDLRAVGGRLTLAGDEGVSLRGRDLDVLVDKVHVVADSVAHKCTTMFQRVRKLFATHAGASQQQIDGDMATQAKTATIVTEEKILLNGKQIHLG